MGGSQALEILASFFATGRQNAIDALPLLSNILRVPRLPQPAPHDPTPKSLNGYLFFFAPFRQKTHLKVMTRTARWDVGNHERIPAERTDDENRRNA